MDISVIICTYCRGEQLSKVLDDFTRQNAVMPASFEVIVVDNNSTDNTKQVCEEFISKHPGTFRYVFEERQGKTFALNTGIRASKGNIIAFTDDDVVIDERWLSSIKHAFAVNQDCKAFGGRVLPLWPDTLPTWVAREGAFKNTGGAIVEHDFGNSVKSYPPAGSRLPCGANMFFAKDIFEKYGGFNESLNVQIKKTPMLEDDEFCNKLIKNNEKMLYIPEVVVSHPVFPERLTKKYIIRHAFKSGRAQYTILNLKNKGRYTILNVNKNRRRLFNVPLYFAKNVTDLLVKYLVALCKSNEKMIFYFEKILIYNIGIVYECFVQRKNEQT